MIKKHAPFLAAAFLTVFNINTAQAEPVPYNVDSGHAYIIFFADHLGYSNFPGTFNGITGTINFDEETPENSSVNVTIPANSVDMNHDVLNEKMLGENFFQVEQYPSLTFESTEITRTGDKTAVIKGNLTMLGVTKEVALNTMFNKKAYNEYANATGIGFSAEGTLNRSDFGMDYLLPNVGDAVPFRIEIEAHHKSPEEASE